MINKVPCFWFHCVKHCQMPFIFTYLSLLSFSTIMVYVCQLLMRLMVNVHTDTCWNDYHLGNYDIHVHRQDHNWGIWIILSYPFTPKAYRFFDSKYLWWQYTPHSTTSVFRGLSLIAWIFWLSLVSHCIWPFIEHQYLPFDKIWDIHEVSKFGYGLDLDLLTIS